MRALAVCMLAALCSAAAVGAVGAEASTVSTFDQRLHGALDELKSRNISLVIGIAHRGEPTRFFEVGAAAQDSLPAQSTQVDINSITKTVTGVMVLKLVERGRLRLDESLGEIFSGVPADKSAITVHQLLTHSAGFVEAIGKDEEVLERDGFLRRAFASGLRSAPGKEYHYSNVGFSVLAAIIEKRSGKSYDSYLREDVLSGTSLHDTGYLSEYDPKRSLLSEKGKPIMEVSWGGHAPFWNLIGNGGLISTPDDFIRFRQLVAAGRIISPALVKLSQQKHIAENARGTSHYGYGLVVQDDPKLGRFYWHDGGNDTLSAMWVDCVDQGDILFTAGADGKAGNAITAMSVLLRHLFGLKQSS